LKLFEFEAKELFKEAGINVPSGSQLIHYPEEVAFLKLNFPVVLKTQVLTGGRGKAGGIKFANNIPEAIEKATELFDLPIKGERPPCLLLDPKVPIKKEFYLAITLDRDLKCPILIGSSEGGMEIETSGSAKIVPVRGEYSAHLGRKLAYEMGLSGKEFSVISGIIDKLYGLYEKYDLDLAEINPLAQLEDGSIVALDGKVTVNDDSIDRQPRFKGWKASHLNDLSEREKRAAMSGLNLVELGEGNIGILCNGAGLTMATMDLVQFKGGNPANFLDVGGGANRNKVGAALNLVITNPKVKVILINILGGITACDEVAAPLVDFKKKYPDRKLVVRLLGNNQDKARDLLKGTGIEFIDDLDQAVGVAVEASK
jgi:succinyl-CoA synthetase beta subunit